MSASVRGVSLRPPAGVLRRARPRRPADSGWQRWERPLTWWSIILLCSAFWYGVLRLAGAA